MRDRGLSGEGMGWWKKGWNEEEEGVQRLKRKLRGKQRQGWAVARARAQVRPDGLWWLFDRLRYSHVNRSNFIISFISRPFVVSPHRTCRSDCPLDASADCASENRWWFCCIAPCCFHAVNIRDAG